MLLLTGLLLKIQFLKTIFYLPVRACRWNMEFWMFQLVATVDCLIVTWFWKLVSKNDSVFPRRSQSGRLTSMLKQCVYCETKQRGGNGGRELQGFHMMLQLLGTMFVLALTEICDDAYVCTQRFFCFGSFLPPYFKMCCLRSWIVFFVPSFPCLSRMWYKYLQQGSTAWKLWIKT